MKLVHVRRFITHYERKNIHKFVQRPTSTCQNVLFRVHHTLVRGRQNIHSYESDLGDVAAGRVALLPSHRGYEGEHMTP